MKSAVLVAALIIAYALLRGWPGDWHLVVRLICSVSILVAGIAVWGQAEESKATQAKSARRGRWLDYLTVALAVLLLEGFFLVFLALAPERGEKIASAMEEALHPEIGTFDQATGDPDEGGAPGEGGPGDGSFTTSGNWLFTGSGARPLNRNGQVRPSNRPEVYLFPKSSTDREILLNESRNLRMFSMARYQDGTWFLSDFKPQSLRSEDDLVMLQSSGNAPRVSYEISHQAGAQGRTLAIGIPDILTMKLPALRAVASATYRLPPLSEGEKVYRYEVTSSPMEFDKLPENISPGQTANPDELALPDDPELLAKLNSLTRTWGPPSRQALNELRKLLQSRYEYSLEIDLSAELDPLESFLFEKHTGYCTHFATAAVMLSRSLGFPARMAYGWSGGRYYSNRDFFLFRAREAHAWAEILVEGYGWVPFETTPPDRTEGTATEADEDEAPPESAGIVLPDLPVEKNPLAQLLSILTWILPAALVLLLLALFLRRSPSQASGISASRTLLPDPPGYLAAFRRACQAHGFPMPPGRTLRAHLAEIPEPPFAEELLSYHYAVNYANAPTNGSTEKKLLAGMKRWESEKSTP